MKVEIMDDNSTNTLSSRIPAIDFVRGLAIILMALDHASTYWNYNRFFGEFWFVNRPTVLPDFWQFLVRFLSHWCAPTFVFLAGTSIILSEARRLEKGIPDSDITKHFVVRGLILLLIEWTLIAWLFQAAPFYFGVLAAIGVGLIIFAFARKLNTKLILGISLFLILDDIFAEFIWNPLFQPGSHPVAFSPFYIGPIFDELFSGSLLYWLRAATYYPEWPYGLYPLDPWLGVLGLGVVFGRWLHQKQQLQNTQNMHQQIAKHLAIIGGTGLVIFFIVRTFQGLPTSFFPIWVAEGVLVENAFAFQNYFFMSKYPPSIVFLLWTLSGMCLTLALAFYLQETEVFRKGANPIILFGTTALFFYCAHLVLYGSVPITLGLQKAFPLEVTLIVWVLGLFILFPICMRFRELKRKYPKSLLQYI